MRSLENDRSGFDPQWWQQGAELGWTSMLAPEALGGGSISDHGIADLVLVAFERGRLVAPGPLVPVNTAVAMLAEAEHSTHDELVGELQRRL